MTKTITINGKTFHLAPMKFGEGRDIFKPGADVFTANCRMIAACLNHGNGTTSSAPANGKTFTSDDISNFDYPDGQALLMQCLELNGLKLAPGEAKA